MIIENPLLQFTDNNATPLNFGYVYIGEVNKNPELFPVSIYWDDALTIPAQQPIRTINGYIVRNGTVSTLYSAVNYSISVKNKDGVLIYSLADSAAVNSLARLSKSDGASLVGFIQNGTGAVPTTVEKELRHHVNPGQFGAVGNGVADDTTAFTNAAALGKSVRLTDSTYKLTSIPTGRYFTDSVVAPTFPNSKPAFFGLFQPATGAHFASGGANIHRFGDRMLVGDAIVNDGTWPNVTQDWLTQYQVAAGLGSGLIASSVQAVLTSNSDVSACAFTAGSQSKNFTSADGSCIGSSSFVVNNNTSYATKAWAFYGEAHKENATNGPVYGMELDVRSKVATITPHPWQQGNVIAYTAGAGAGLAAAGQFDASCVLQVAANPMQFKAGIVFMNDSMPANAAALAMGPVHFLRWYESTGNPAGGITTTNTVAANYSELRFDTQGPFLQSATSRIFGVFNVASAVNYAAMSPSVSGNPVIMNANGTDANIDIRILPKGTGVNWIGAWAMNADAAVNGYITVKDSAGNFRKIATIA